MLVKGENMYGGGELIVSSCDTPLCDVVPMHVRHMLLGHPWQFDRKVTYGGYKNIYAFVLKNYTIELTPL